MHWSSETGDSGAAFADLPVAVGKAGTTDSVAIISAIWWVIRNVPKLADEVV
ncbi:MAG TPA: hypothetical protein VGB04_02120 [Allosphingosinicella sp.]|jgi:hypothetical protein